MIEHVSDLIITLAQFIYIIWPLVILTALAYSFQGRYGRGWLSALLRRTRDNLTVTWLVLLMVWMITLFSTETTPTLIPEPANSILFFGGLFLLLCLQAVRLRHLPGRIVARIDLHEAQGLAYLKQLDPDHFEELVAETYRALGHKAQRIGRSGDHGIDVEVFTTQGQRWIVQCKRCRDSVGEGIVRELYGTVMSEKANRGVLVTSANITPPAEAWARGKPLDLVDGLALLKLMDQARDKADGTPFDRFTAWLEGLLRPQPAPSGLSQSAGPRR